MIRTVSIKADFERPKKIWSLMDDCAKIFNAHVAWSFENKTWNKTKAHHALYTKLREKFPDIPSALIQSVRDTALESIKSTKFKHKPKAGRWSSIRYDKRTSTLRGNVLTISSKGKRIRCEINIPEYFKEYATWDFQGLHLCYDKQKKQFWFRLIFRTDDPNPVPGDSLGVDRGLYTLATTSKGELYSGREIRASQRRYLHNRKTLQAKGTPSARRRLRRMSGKEKRFSRDVNHCISKKISNVDGVSVFVLEDLKGIRKRRKGKKLNKWLGSWPFHQFQIFLEYKAQSLGKQVVYVDPRYTSQKCNMCQHKDKKNRIKGKFCCTRCGYKNHADINAALNIRDLHILSTHEGRSGSGQRPVCDAPAVASLRPRAVGS